MTLIPMKNMKMKAIALFLMLAATLPVQSKEVGPFNGLFIPEGYGFDKTLAKDAPLQAGSDWTLNFWLKPEGNIPTKTLLGGFGKGDNAKGKQRYLAVFEDGLRFWGGGIDVLAKTSLEPDKWQMLTVVYAGGVLSIYRDDVQLVSQPIALADAEPEARLAPNSPWSKGGHFFGRIALFTLQDRALSAEEIHALFTNSGDLDKLTFEHTWPIQNPMYAGLRRGNPNQSHDTFPKSNAPFPFSKPGPAQSHSKETLVLNEDGALTIAGPWKMAEAPKVLQNGEAISQRDFKPLGWYDATVPGTVLTTLVNQGVYPDPYFGINNLSIPESLNKQDYWYRVEFTTPREFSGRNVSLTFNGINYHAEVWLNGVRLGEIVGAFTRGTFDLGSALKPGTLNVLAVRVAPPPNPGIPYEKSVKTGNGPNGGAMCMDGPTFFCSEGWFWIPGIRDRNTGIWQNVVLRASDAVRIGDPQIVTRVPSPIGSKAEVTVSAELKNSGETEQTGILKGEFEGVTFEQKVKLAAHANQQVTFTPQDFPQLAVANPRLWWPNGYGKPELYHLHLSFSNPAGKVSDTAQATFGMREISVVLSALGPGARVGRYEFFPAAAGEKEVIKHEHNSLVLTPKGWMPRVAEGAENYPALRPSDDNDTGSYLVIKVNGQRIAIRGGNWGMDDAMKRVSRERLEPYLRLERDANFNTIRNWCGQSTEKEFYDLCDEYGLLVWNDFWIGTQDYNVEPSAPEPFLSNAADTIKRFRNHPSIVLWCGRNEGVPPPAINKGLDALIRRFDGTRYYQPNSIQINMTRSGPWRYNEPDQYFTNLAKGFSTEIGLLSPLSVEAIKTMMAPEDLWPPNDVWAYHDWVPADYWGPATYMTAMNAQFGAPTNLEDFVRKAQMLNYVAHRAIYEGMNASLWKPVTGRLIWMSHPSWPSSVWQIYSWDYEPNASYFGVKKGCEPVHVQMNLPNHSILVSNTRITPLEKVKVTARVYNMQCALISSKDATLDVAANSIASSFIVDTAAGTPVSFVKLELRDSSGTLLSDNFYWLAAKDADYMALNDLPKVQLVSKARARRDSKTMEITVELENSSKTVALMTSLSLRNAKNNLRILPVYASDNYISLLPGEKRAITLECSAKVGEDSLYLMLDGWNVSPEKVKIQ